MKKLALFLAIALIAALTPTMGFTEDQNTLRLARVIYAMAGDASYDVKLAVGSVVMNRVEDPWFPAALENVLKEKHQFPAGTRYDEASLSAAHAVISGKSTLDAKFVYVYVPGAESAVPENAKWIDGYAFCAHPAE